jgi:hypothetical protein
MVTKAGGDYRHELRERKRYFQLKFLSVFTELYKRVYLNGLVRHFCSYSCLKFLCT